MYMGSCPLAIDKVFNNVDGLCLLHDLVGTSVPWMELITSANRRCEEHVGVHWIFRDRRVVLHEHCGSARTERINRGLTTRVKGEQTVCTVCTVQNVW